MNSNFAFLEIPLIKKLYELYKYSHKAILVFPKHERYSLGEKIETNILEAIELIFFANCQPKNFKEGYLIKANVKIETLKILFRLAMDNNFINDSQYIQNETYLQESGKMLSGWIKYLRSNFVQYADKNAENKNTKK